MNVMKFGGTSLGDADRIRGAAQIVRSRLAGGPLVVASAMGGVTNELLALASLARDGETEQVRERLGGLERRHRDVAEALGLAEAVVPGLDGPSLSEFLEARFAETRDRLRGVSLLGELTSRSCDSIVSTGELASSAILAAAVGDVRWFDVRRVMLTDEGHGSARVEFDELSRLCREQLEAVMGEGHAVVTQGFLGRSPSGVTTTLGRGGSDYTASLLGAALGSKEIEIWTDVDGMLSADPRLVPDARHLSEVSFDEASELAYFGAKVLHPATIRPAVKRNIPVRILNTFRPDGRGTLIRMGPSAAAEPVRAIATRRGITVILISNPRMLMAHGFSAQVFDVFGRHRIAVDLIATSEVSISLTVDDARGLPGAVKELETMADVTVLPDQAIVAVVGNGIRSRPGVAARVFGAVSNINVVMISMGASDLNISFVVAQAEAADAVARLHREFLGGSDG